MRIQSADTTNPESLASKMRRARVARFFDVIQSSRKPTVQILDVGGTEHFWASLWSGDCQTLHITLLNLEPVQIESDLPIEAVVGDARKMPQFRNGEFDFCFSNSVIEHVGTLSDQMRMADEVRRVAKGYFVQTPYRYFPIEPHVHFPFWNQLPIWVRTKLHQNLNLGWVKAEPDYLKARADIEGGRLISIREFRLLFPDAQVELEKLGPLVKSMTAVKAAASS